MKDNIYRIERMMPTGRGQVEGYLRELTREVERVIENINANAEKTIAEANAKIEELQRKTEIKTATVQPAAETEQFKVEVRKQGSLIAMEWQIRPTTQYPAGTYLLLFVLPEGFRPLTAIYQNCATSAGTSAIFFINTNGEVKINVSTAERTYTRGSAAFMGEEA